MAFWIINARLTFSKQWQRENISLSFYSPKTLALWTESAFIPHCCGKPKTSANIFQRKNSPNSKRGGYSSLCCARRQWAGSLARLPPVVLDRGFATGMLRLGEAWASLCQSSTHGLGWRERFAL